MTAMRKYFEQDSHDTLLVDVWRVGQEGMDDDKVWIDVTENVETAQIKLDREQAIDLARYILTNLGVNAEDTAPTKKWEDV